MLVGHQLTASLTISRSKFALCLVRHITGDQDRPRFQKISLQINSQHLKTILNNTISNYPGVSFSTKDVIIASPYHVLFHYRKELEAQRHEVETEPEALQHLNLLLDFVNEEFKDTIRETNNLVEQGMITYEHLWTIFRPGTILYAPMFGQPRAWTLKSYYDSCDPPGFGLCTEFVDFDGEDMGTRGGGRIVAHFAGSEKIVSLSAYPMEWHPNADAMKQQLIARGRRWENHVGMHFSNYQGIALEFNGCRINRYNVDGRIVIDTKTFHRLIANKAFSVDALARAEEKPSKRQRITANDDGDEDEDGATLELIPQHTLELESLTDEQCMLATAFVRGFSFSEKLWLDFFIDMVSHIEWNTNCFNELVLPPAQKDLVKALVATHVQQRLDFDDIVKGKGKGLILVLHGPPGVGKTLTAETVAEYSKRPLYMVSSGELGTDSSTLDQRLSRILDMASTWKAVLLIDEADIFLERRSLHDIERNSLVSIFLRVLEYYEGILFLTSNRVSTFDDAFKSRIHVPLKYNDLTASSRKTIWQTFLGKLGDDVVQIDEEGYDVLAKAEINGRQIKNVIRTAKSLAQFHGARLDREKLLQVVEIQIEFEHELGPDKGLVHGTHGVLNGDGVRLKSGKIST